MKKLRLLLRERQLGAVRVGTVDDFQGQEARIIFISTVLSRPADGLLTRGSSKGGVLTPQGIASDPAIGFFRNPNRFNVAITRAQALMVVLGHPLVLMQVSKQIMYALKGFKWKHCNPGQGMLACKLGCICFCSLRAAVLLALSRPDATAADLVLSRSCLLGCVPACLGFSTMLLQAVDFSHKMQGEIGVSQAKHCCCRTQTGVSW